MQGQVLVPISRRHRRKQNAVGLLPRDEVEDAFAREEVGAAVERIECLAEFVDGIAPPKCSLAVGAIHVGIAHRDVERPQSLRAEAVHEIVVAGKFPSELAVESGLAVFEIENLDACRDFVVNLVAIHPTGELELLLAVAGHILGPHIRLAAAAVVVHLDFDRLARLRIDFQIRGDLRVVGELSFDQLPIRDGGKRRGICVGLEAEVFPQRHRAFDQPPPRSAIRRPQILGRSPCGRVEAGPFPACEFLARIVTDVGFGQPVIWVRGLGVAVGRMHHRAPRRIAHQFLRTGFHLKQQPAFAAAHVAESLLAEIPHEDRDSVFPLLQMRRQIDLIEKGIRRSRPAFQRALAHGQHAIDPEPVFRIDCNARDGFFRLRGEVEFLPVGGPEVLLFGISSRLHPDPLRRPTRSRHRARINKRRQRLGGHGVCHKTEE